MNSPGKKKGSLKKKLFDEMFEYWINVIYLILVFAAFTQYRRFILAAYDITYTNYWVAVIEALVLAKVIMVGDVARLGRGLGKKSLIYPTLFKTVIFSLFVGAFTLIEQGVKNLWSGKELSASLVIFFGKGYHELLAECLVVFVAFIPFFAFRELGRVLGEGKIWTFFFQRSADHESGKGEKA
jgi:hypothetical protein